MKRFLHLFSLLGLAFAIACGSQQKEYQFVEGDLFFQDLDCGPFCDAIEKVTEGYGGAKLSHVGVLIRYEDSWKILEAGEQGVKLTAVDSFLNRSSDADGKPKVIVGRMKNLDPAMLGRAKQIGLAMLGRPYDDYFDIDNQAYYCSELIYESFLQQGGERVFQLAAMTFKDPDTERFFPLWEDYFAELKYDIPEGEPGLNPGSMSTASSVDIVYKFGSPDGMR
jgi:hypothetical protein